MEKGLYLYCIRSKTDETIAVQKTISIEEKIQIIPYDHLEAVVSEVSIEEFTSEDIQKKAEEDLDWIQTKAQIHEEVIEQAMKKNNTDIIPVIPMQFGVIFKTKEKLQESLKNNLEKLKKSLEYLTEKQEWGVKVFLNQKNFEGFLEKENEELLAKKREAESLPRGMAFFAKKQTSSLIEEIKEKESNKIVHEINADLSPIAANIFEAKRLENDFTGMTDKMILNSFYLLETFRIADFQEIIKILKEKYQPKGIEVKITGPWPPYHFA